MRYAIDWKKNTEMQNYAIKMSDLAEADLESAGDYIAFVLSNPIAAESTVKGIREAVNKLQFFPQSHELEGDPILAELGIHRTYFKEYKIFFLIDHMTRVVHIIRILHILVDSRVWLYETLNIAM